MASVFWFTGLSGAGKTTVAQRVARHLARDGLSALLLDGDALRQTPHNDLGFSAADIKENNRRIVDLCRRHRPDHDAILVPIISPLRESRSHARACLEPGFYEIFFSVPLECVQARDPKGLYAKARRGEITDMIGYAPHNPYEPPTHPDLVVDTANRTPDDSATALYEFINAQIARPLS